jgi:hypothetical protein
MSNTATPNGQIFRTYAVHHRHPYVPGQRLNEGRVAIHEFSSIVLDDEGQVARIHDGVTPGGYAFLPYYNPSLAALAPFFPFAPRAVSTSLPQNVAVDIPNPLNRICMVQILDANGNVAQADVQHVNTAPAGSPPVFVVRITQTAISPALSAIVLMQ